MKFLKKRATALMIQTGSLLWLWTFFSFASTGWCQQAVVKKVTQPVLQSIQIRQKSQKKRDQWEQEKSNLISLYEQLQYEHEMLMSENKELNAAKLEQKAVNQTLLKQKRESLKIQKELLPFLKATFARLETLVSFDPPFLEEERSARLKTIDKVLNDHDISIAEKYRKMMEALFIEAEYGSTIEVYQNKEMINGEQVLGNIFRLGRVSLFFLSLDQQSSAYYNVARKKWLLLSDKYLPAIRSAVEIGSKRRSAKLLSLPLGRLAKQGEEK